MFMRAELAADCMHGFSRIVMGDLEMPRRTKAFQRAKEIIPAVRATPKAVSYTHLDVYKRQTWKATVVR